MDGPLLFREHCKTWYQVSTDDQNCRGVDSIDTISFFHLDFKRTIQQRVKYRWSRLGKVRSYLGRPAYKFCSWMFPLRSWLPSCFIDELECPVFLPWMSDILCSTVVQKLKLSTPIINPAISLPMCSQPSVLVWGELPHLTGVARTEKVPHKSW